MSLTVVIKQLVATRPTKTGRSANLIVVTGGLGFLGRSIVANLLKSGTIHVRCVVRHGTAADALDDVRVSFPDSCIELYPASLDNIRELELAVEKATVVYHAAAAKKGSRKNQIRDTVVASENLFKACVRSGIRRFVLVSSLAVIDTNTVDAGGTIDETLPIDSSPEKRDPYSFAKILQEKSARSYARDYSLPLVIVRPGIIFGNSVGPMSPRVGTTFAAMFLHLGGCNSIPLTYVENCADAVVRAGKEPNAIGETFCIVDDNLPTSKAVFLLYRRAGKVGPAIRLPRWLLLFLAKINVAAAAISFGKLPIILSPTDIETYWTAYRYSNIHARKVLNWSPEVSMADALEQTSRAIGGK